MHFDVSTPWPAYVSIVVHITTSVALSLASTLPTVALSFILARPRSCKLAGGTTTDRHNHTTGNKYIRYGS